MSDWLRASNWRTYHAPVGINVNCSQRVSETLQDRAETIVETSGQRLIVLGQSRGGLHGRALVGLRPDLVHTSIALGSPVLDMWNIRPSVARQIDGLARLGACGVPGLFTRECADGPCCAAYRSALIAPLPDTTRAFAVYSMSDEIVAAQACMDPHAECHEVESSHQMMGMNVAIWRVVADLLANLE